MWIEPSNSVHPPSLKSHKFSVLEIPELTKLSGFLYRIASSSGKRPSRRKPPLEGKAAGIAKVESWAEVAAKRLEMATPAMM